MDQSMSGAFRQALEDGDAGRLAVLWRAAYPNLPQSKTDAETEMVLHRARSEAESVTLAKRLYSHAWLAERGLPSGLPEELRPPVERRESVIVPAVGIAVKARSPERVELARAVEAAMAAAAAECHAYGIIDRPRVAARMWEARARTLRQYGERINGGT
jgi:hypothetical protein